MVDSHIVSERKAKIQNVKPPPRCRLKARKDCDASLRTFLETCFPEAFPLAWSPDHLRMIQEVEQRIKTGGLKAIAYPRGSGKTSILLRAALWAVLTGHRKYVVLVGANGVAAVSSLNAIKAEINFNPMLLKLYARETQCLRQLGGEPRRATSQMHDGEKTLVEYSIHRIGFGHIPNCVTAGACIAVAGITGQLRGQQTTTPDGKILRPDLVLVDDPQTKSSAASPAQCLKRYEIMTGDVLGLAGPGIKIAGFCTCTVIYADDLADRLLNRQLSPDWHGDRISMIKKWPTWLDGWDKYNALRTDELAANDHTHAESIKFVKDNFDKLHDGSLVYWEERKNKRDVSALQHAMDLYFRDQGVFYAEFQNAPQASTALSAFDMNRDDIARRIVGLPRGTVPEDVDKVTAFIDVQRELLYFMVMAWTDSGRGYIIDYGACPDQKTHYWSKPSVRFKLTDVFGHELESSLVGGLEWLVEAIMQNEYRDHSGGLITVDRLAIDARWGESTHIIRKFARESRWKARINPSMGMYIGANSRPWQKLKQDKRDRKGVHAKLKSPDKEAGRRELLYDANFWKSFAADRLTCDKSSTKAIVLFHGEPHEHRMIGEHFCSEDPLRITGKDGNDTIEWKAPRMATHVENDLWDCLVGNCALASVIGVRTHEARPRARDNRLAQMAKQYKKGFLSR